MKSNWIKDMLETIGVELDLGLNKEDLKRKKTESRLAKVTKERRSLENNYDNLKNFSKVNDTISGLFIFYNLVRFSGIAILVTIGYRLISDMFIKNSLKSMKREMESKDGEILKLQTELENMFLSGTTDKSYKTNGESKPYVDAEIIEEYSNEEQVNEEAPQPESTSHGTIKEAQQAFEMLDKLDRIISSLESHDRETGILFRNAYQSARKVSDFMIQNPANQTKLYLFYNHVETLYDWSSNLLELEETDVYESLLVNIKSNARKALPILQAKIDKEYFKMVNPKIMDLEAEMEVMSKEDIY